MTRGGTAAPAETPLPSWSPAIDTARYDRRATLSVPEREALAPLLTLRGKGQSTETTIAALDGADRLRRPLLDVLADMEAGPLCKRKAILGMLRWCARTDRAFWGWDGATWCEVLGTTQANFFSAHRTHMDATVRQPMIAAAYRLGCFRDLRALGRYDRVGVAGKVFGRKVLEDSLQAVECVTSGWGYALHPRSALRSVAAEALLLHGSPRFDGLTVAQLEEWRSWPRPWHGHRALLFQLGRALEELGVLERAPVACSTDPQSLRTARGQGLAPTWLAWVERWEGTSTLSSKTRACVAWAVLKAGRWLQRHHPTVSAPGEWMRELAVAYVAAVDRMHVGDYVQRTAGLQPGRLGQPLSPRAKDRCLQCLRTFFLDIQEWGWTPLRFNPARALATPRAVKAAIGPAPRIIADDIWAKLLWAGLNLSEDDLLVTVDRGIEGRDGTPTRRTNTYYPLAMLQALAVTWLFAGLRSDEIVRLRVGCIRDHTRPGTSEPAVDAEVCLLDVPVHKTGRAFTKPVDPVVGEAIASWERLRPRQPDFADRKTGEAVQLLFCYRARPVPRSYLNGGLIPLLCRKAGVPPTDARGPISSHRARSTIASQLFNARAPMTLFELQAWLGHRSPETTQNYVACTPTRLIQSYRDAGYFARNVRAIEVLVDQQAV